VDFSVKFSMEGFEANIDDDKSATIAIADWSIVIDRAGCTLTSTDNYGRTYEDVMALKMPAGPGASGPRHQDPSLELVESGPMLVSEFKRKHELKTVEFDRLSRLADVKRKGAAAKLTSDEVQRLLTQMEKEKAQREKRASRNEKTEDSAGD